MERSSASGPSPLSASERREVEALRAGDERAFLALVNRHHRSMLRVASLYVRSAASAEEVVQDAWMGVLRGVHLFEGRSSLKSWILGILTRCAKARAVRDGRSVPLSALEAEEGDQGPSVSPNRFESEGSRWAGHWTSPLQPWPDARVESGEIVRLVQEAIETLPEAQRTVMSLRDVEGWTSDEVCELLGVSQGNQRVLLHRARSRVRSYLERKLGREGAP